MKNKITFKNDEITVHMPNAVKNLNVKIVYIFPNPYQLVVKDVTFSSNKYYEINTVDIRKVNYFSLKKKGLKLINNIANVDSDYFYKNTKNKVYMSIDLKKISKLLILRKFNNKELKLAAYAYYYVFNTYNYSTNYSLYLSHKLGYSESYVKNLTKDIFKYKYLIKNTAGTAGGILSKKTIKLLNSQKFQQLL
tara:strand:- start:651 stop:1229 length:579 start_codon:yes stop_codon:yes gene_type:complete